MNQDVQNAQTGGTHPAAPKLKPIEQWNPGPLWAWVVGAVLIIAIFTFVCAHVYEASHSGLPSPGNSQAAMKGGVLPPD